MSKNKFIIFVTIVAITLMLGIPTYSKVHNNHKTRVYMTLKEKLKTKAIQCWSENKCESDTIYLKDLYSNNYLDKLIDPMTNKEVNENSYIQKDNKEVVVKLFT